VRSGKGGVGIRLAVARVAASGPAALVEELAEESEASDGGAVGNAADGVGGEGAAGVVLCTTAAAAFFAVPFKLLFEAVALATAADSVVPTPGSFADASAAVRAAAVSSASRAGLVVALATEPSLRVADAKGVVACVPVPVRSNAFEPAVVEVDADEAAVGLAPAAAFAAAAAAAAAADAAAADEAAVADSVAFSV
jgi:hypothetical protein